MDRDKFFHSLWEQYISVTPQAKKIQTLFSSRRETVLNDHVAFRTFNKIGFDLDTLAASFTNIGYQIFDSYEFPEKHLRAYALGVPTELELPRIFISELLCEKLSHSAQVIIENLTKNPRPDSEFSVESLLGTYPFRRPTFEQYSIVANESEYAAWLITMGYQANHFTLSVNALQSLKSIQDVVALLQQNEHELNTVGGVIKGTPESLLLQASTIADTITFEFADGIKKRVPSCFYEFAQRYKDGHGTLFQGFIPNNANAIFESTNRK